MIWWLLVWGGIGVVAIGSYVAWRSRQKRQNDMKIEWTDKRYRELLEVERRQEHER